MNKRILFGVLFLALGATCERSLKAKPEGSTKLISQAPSSDGWSMKKLIDNIKSASKSTPRTAISNEQQARDFFTPPARDTAKHSTRAPEVTREKIERESREAVHVSQPKDKKDHIRTATEMTTTTINPQTEKATREKREGSSAERTRTERIAQENTTIFSDSSQVLAKEPKKKAAEAEDIGVAKKPKPTIIGDIEVPVGTIAPGASTVAQWKAEADTKKEKATREKREGSSAERTRTERIAEEKIAITIPAPPPLPTDLTDKKGKFGMYAPTEAELVEKKGQLKPTPSISPASTPLPITATTPTDEGKPGMSGKKKAAIGAGVVGAGAVGAGAVGVGAAALGAGLIGAAGIGIGAAMSGDKDKPAPEVAPERVEDIKGLDAGSGLGQSFEASAFDG